MLLMAAFDGRVQSLIHLMLLMKTSEFLLDVPLSFDEDSELDSLELPRGRPDCLMLNLQKTHDDAAELDVFYPN